MEGDNADIILLDFNKVFDNGISLSSENEKLWY